MTPFEEWLERAKITDDPEGDFVYDMRRDPHRPTTFASLESMLFYVGSKSNYDTAVLASVPGAWQRYRAWCRQR
jgi:hypothetical protein